MRIIRSKLSADMTLRNKLILIMLLYIEGAHTTSVSKSVYQCSNGTCAPCGFDKPCHPEVEVYNTKVWCLENCNKIVYQCTNGTCGPCGIDVPCHPEVEVYNTNALCQENCNKIVYQCTNGKCAPCGGDNEPCNSKDEVYNTNAWCQENCVTIATSTECSDGNCSKKNQDESMFEKFSETNGKQFC